MKYLFLFISLLSITTAFSQGKLADKLSLETKFMTFEKSRLSAGVNLGLGLAYHNTSQEDIPTGLGVSGGLLLDIYSPLSATGFTTGVNINILEYKYEQEINSEEVTIDSFNLRTIEIPFFLRFKTGSVGARNRLVIMPGISYNIPNEAKLESLNQQTLKDKNILKKYLQYKFQIGWEILLGKKSYSQATGKYEAEARTRLLIYAGVDYTRDSYYNIDFNQIPGYYKNNFANLAGNNPINYKVGINLYFTLADWKEIGSGIMN